jgi:DNA-binding transcriptional regulator of glucitol operon
MSNIAWILLVLAACWILQLGLTWRQARRFMAAVSAMRRQSGGRVTVGMGKHKFRKAYVALAVEGVTVTRALVLRGATVLADAKPEPLLTNRRLGELARGRVAAELPEPVKAAAIQAADFLSTKDSRAGADGVTSSAVSSAASLAPGGKGGRFGRRPPRPGSRRAGRAAADRAGAG